jgi:hypothetical protein
MQRNLGLLFASNFNPLVYRLEECSRIGDITLLYEHMRGALSDAVSWLSRAMAVLMAAETAKDRPVFQPFAPV